MGVLTNPIRNGNVASEVPMPPGKAARELWEARIIAGLDQEFIADGLGVNQKTVEAIENGRVSIAEDIETKWRRLCRRWAVFIARHLDAIPPGSYSEFLGDTSDLEELLEKRLAKELIKKERYRQRKRAK